MATDMRLAPREILQLVSCELAGEVYGIDISAVQEIVRMTEITRIPRSPEFVEGVVNLRGKIVPVVDLRRRLALPCAEETKHTRIVIVAIQSRTVGLIVDGVDEVLRLSTEAMEPTPEIATEGIDASYLKGIGKLESRLLILLDLEKVLSGTEVALLDTAIA